ncbi:MAG TPA: prepilin-type N-terminal cleavage/methylation domain-containing protein, partial [Phycisphaerae bacterium]|nr:prepilin-type N-terminal cleavage/methylation domain-containing protein [Phycisphaerae bacterium]
MIPRSRQSRVLKPGSAPRHGGGFTLIELLVVIAIIALLLSVLLPALSLAREQGRTVKCGANLEQIGTALSICQNEYNNFYPYWDDEAINPSQKNILGTWLDVLKQRHAHGMEGGYCPSDNRPDFLNAQRGAAWSFRYPPPATMQGRIGGADYSYGISIPLASGAHMSEDNYSHDGLTEATKLLFQRGVSNRVLAGDAFWTWLHNMSGAGIVTNDFSTPNWYSSTAGYRHGLSITYRPGANFLRQDLHVEEVKFDLRRPTSGIDTNLHYVTYAGEPLDVYPALGTDGGSA